MKTLEAVSITGIMLIAGALIALSLGSTVSFIGEVEPFNDTYEEDWESFGELNNLEENPDNDLVLEEGSFTGSFVSDNFFKGNSIGLDSVVVEADDISSTGNVETDANITVYALDNDEVVSSETFSLVSGTNIFDLTGLSGSFNSYSFDLEFESSDDEESAVVESVVFDGFLFNHFLSEDVDFWMSAFLLSLFLGLAGLFAARALAG